MLLIVFVAFLALVVAWLVAPNGEVKAVQRPAEGSVAVPGLKVREAGA